MHKKLNKLFWNQNDLFFIFKLKITLFYLLALLFISFITGYHSLFFHCHFLLLVIICYHLSSLIVSPCYLLLFVVSLFVTPSLYHLVSLIVNHCTTCCHSLWYDVPLVSLFINNPLGDKNCVYILLL